jgi:hypothetical protein
MQLAAFFRPARAAIGLGLGLIGGLGAAAPASAAVYYLKTGHTGAQTQADYLHPTTWSIDATSDWSLGGGDLTMKDGGQAVASDIIFSIYQGDDASTAPVATLDYTVDDFCTAHGGNCHTFSSTPFHFATPYDIVSGGHYFVTLTSTAPDQQNKAYFIKDPGDFSFVDGDSQMLVAPQLTSEVAAAPEPLSLAVLGTGLIGLAATRRWRGTSDRADRGRADRADA